MVKSIRRGGRASSGGGGLFVLEDKPNRDIIERAEDLILRLREVQSARIDADEQGRISEIHVVAATDRAPKLIARDVESCLKAALGLAIDYRKIGVVVIEPGKGPPVHHASGNGASHGGAHEIEPIVELEEIVDERLSESPGEQREAGPRWELGEKRERWIWGGPPGERASERSAGERAPETPAGDRPAERPVGGPARPPRPGPGGPSDGPRGVEAPRAESARLEFLEVDARVRFKGLRVTIEEDRLDAEVRLARGPLEVTGSQGDYRVRGKLYETIAGATLHAVSELLDENIRLCLSGVQEVTLGGRMALCAVVSALDGRSTASYVGCAMIGEERGESAVLAVLDALNRPLGTWKLRTSVHYTIK
jgi:hypothetical protein